MYLVAVPGRIEVGARHAVPYSELAGNLNSDKVFPVRTRWEIALRILVPFLMIGYVVFADRVACDYMCEHGESFSKFFGAIVYLAALAWLAFQWINARGVWLTRYWNGIRIGSMLIALLPIMYLAAEPQVSILGLLWLILLARSRLPDPRPRWIQFFRTTVFALAGFFTLAGAGYWIQTLPSRTVHDPSPLHERVLWMAHRLQMVSLDELGFLYEGEQNPVRQAQIGALYSRLTGENICDSHFAHACN